MPYKPRRTRTTAAMRALVAENSLACPDLVYPVFVQNGLNDPEPIPSMPGRYRYSPDDLLKIIEDNVKLGVRSFLIFGIPDHKDEQAKESYSNKGAVQRAVQKAKQHFPDVLIMTDVCVCAYTPHGHCGVLHNKHIDDEKTNYILARMALSHAEAGADVVAPSAMMDDQVQAIRTKLDESEFRNTAIMAYAAKYFSAFYGPFRDAAGSAPQFGDRASYQMDPANQKEAMKEMAIDMEQGADMLMVKPALPYLDIITMAAQQFDLPLAAYNVSGTYSMIKAASEKGWINEEQVVMEMATSVKRAGAKILISYFAPDIAKYLKNSNQ